MAVYNSDPWTKITDSIITELESGTIPWERSWRPFGPESAQNLATGRPYEGVLNQLNLLISKEIESFGPNLWLTYKQAEELGGHVKKGERGTTVYFWRTLKAKDNTEATEDPENQPKAKVIPMVKVYSVFNADQCEGVDKKLPTLVNTDNDIILSAESIVNTYLASDGPKLTSKLGLTPLYNWTTDSVEMPDIGQFKTSDSYYRSLFHELTHSTGHKTRLDRQPSKRFGDILYSKEELIAELGASFLAAECGIKPAIEHSAAYIEGWLKVLKNDRKLLVVSAAQASKAAKWVLGDRLNVKKAA
jgi:antirestriction protein ArdC